MLSLRAQWPAWLVIAAYVVVAAFTFTGYGVTWDEEVQSRYGAMVIDYFASGFQDRSWNEFLNLAYYGPIFEVWPALVYRVAGAWKFEIRHAFVALSAAAGLIGVLKIAERLGAGRVLPLTAVLGLVLMPAWYGHSFFNSKDIPFATAFTWTIYALIRLPEHARETLRFGLLVALALLIRVNGVVLFVLSAATIATAALIDRETRERLPDLIGRFVLGAFLAWTVMIAFWPWAHLDPVRNPFEALRETMRFQPTVQVVFEGQTLLSSNLPRHYLVGMIAVTSPLPALTLCAIGLAALSQRLLRRSITFAQLAVLLWCVVPVAVQGALRSPTYDGTRHFIFVYPAIALVGGFGADSLVRVLRGSRVAVGAIVLTLLAVVPQMATLHPYEYVFYNAAVGGTGGAVDRYETDYWGASLRESARWIAAHPCNGRKTSVVAASDLWLAAGYEEILPPDRFTVHWLLNRRETPPPKEFDYYFGFRRYKWETKYPELPLRYTVDRMGATLGFVRGGCE